MARLARVLLLLPLLALTLGAGKPFPSSIQLPTDFFPEGIAVGTGSTFYVGSLETGDVYRGDLRSGEGGVLVHAPAGRQAVGLKVEERRHRLFVAGGLTGHAYVYDTRTGATLADLVLTATPALVNDVALTRDAAYFTDSFSPVLYKVPIARDGSLGAPETIALSGPAAATPVDFPNLNGIAATPSGRTLVVGHTALGALFTVDPDSGASRSIDVTGAALTTFNDGLLLHGRTLWVVENFENRVLEVRLSPDLSSGHVVDVITNGEVGGLFRVPATVARHGSRLALVNARFDQGFPPSFGGPPLPRNLDFDVVLVGTSR